MPKFTLDLSGISESLRVEPGHYQAVIGKVELVESADKKSHNLRWSFTISEGPFAGTPLSMFTSLKPTALWRLKSILRNLGLDVDSKITVDVDEDTGIVVDPPLVGLPCTLVVVDDTYNGVVRSSVSDVLKPGVKPEPTVISSKVRSDKTPVTSGLKLR